MPDISIPTQGNNYSSALPTNDCSLPLQLKIIARYSNEDSSSRLSDRATIGALIKLNRDTYNSLKSELDQSNASVQNTLNQNPSQINSDYLTSQQAQENAYLTPYQGCINTLTSFLNNLYDLEKSIPTSEPTTPNPNSSQEEKTATVINSCQNKQGPMSFFDTFDNTCKCDLGYTLNSSGQCEPIPAPTINPPQPTHKIAIRKQNKGLAPKQSQATGVTPIRTQATVTQTAPTSTVKLEQPSFWKKVLRYLNPLSWF